MGMGHDHLNGDGGHDGAADRDPMCVGQTCAGETGVIRLMFEPVFPRLREIDEVDPPQRHDQQEPNQRGGTRVHMDLVADQIAAK